MTSQYPGQAQAQAPGLAGPPQNTITFTSGPAGGRAPAPAPAGGFGGASRRKKVALNICVPLPSYNIHRKCLKIFSSGTAAL